LFLKKGKQKERHPAALKEKLKEKRRLCKEEKERL